MELHQLEYFAAVWRSKSFTKAAKMLHVTQPTVTTAIKNLERELGTTLINRESSTLALTSIGEEVLQRSQVILNNVSQIYQKTSSTDQYQRQKLSIAVPPISCAQLYPLLLKEFAPAHQHIDLQIMDVCNQEAITKITEGAVDLGFIILPVYSDPKLEYCSLQKGELLVLLSKDHPLAEKECISLDEIAQERIIMYEKGTSYIEMRLEDEFQKRNIPFHVSQYFKNFTTIFDLTAQAWGISFIMTTHSSSLQNMPGLITRPFTEPMEYETGLIWKKDMFLPHASEELIEFLCKAYN